MARRVKLDFSNVQSYKKCAEGIHTVKLVQIDEGTSQAGDDMLKAVFEVTKGESKGARVFENFVLTEKALWKFKLYLIAIGQKADGKVAVDLDKLIGKTCEIEVSHEEYNGQTRARILNYNAIGSSTTADVNDEDDEDDEEEDSKVEKKPKKKQPEPEEDWEDDEDWEEV